MSTANYNLDAIKAMPHNRAVEELVDYLCHKTNNICREFFQAEVAYFLGLVPSALRVMIDSPERGLLPVNIYTIAVATSGFGKGHSVNIMEEVLSPFRQAFSQTIMPMRAETNLFDMAVKIAAAKGGDEAQELEALTTDYKNQGYSPFTFDSGTGPALKQLRYKLLLSGCGAINFQMDEIGSNLVQNNEIITVLLELYDLGRVKTKLIKNTSDNQRGQDVEGSTPANILLFGTTSKLFDGSKTEDEFYSLLETGYARRCLFGVGLANAPAAKQKPEDVYDGLVAKNRSAIISKYKSALLKFADPVYLNKKMAVPRDVGIELVNYRLFCEGIANDLPEHETIRKAEISHRYFKAIKLAGVFAFLAGHDEIKMKCLHESIKLVEESGSSFNKLLNRERNFVRLAKYIAASPDNLTHADLVEDLPYYPNSTVPRREILDLAMAWGVGNHVVIKRNVISGVEFFSGSTLEETDLNKLKFSYSDEMASNYLYQEQPMDKMPNLLSAADLHWCNHGFTNNHRKEDNVIEGFNCLVVDVDGSIQLDAVQELLSDYTYITATSKRHTDKANRFRLIMPTNYVLELDKGDYRDFMDSFLMWLPFDSDQSANQRSKKWMTNENSIIKVHRGELIDVLPFIPKTKTNSEYVNSVVDLGNLGNLERWFLSKLEAGNRNNVLLNFAMMLFDGGMKYDELKSKVHLLNSKAKSPLKKTEVESTVLFSVASKY